VLEPTIQYRNNTNGYCYLNVGFVDIALGVYVERAALAATHRTNWESPDPPVTWFCMDIVAGKGGSAPEPKVKDDKSSTRIQLYKLEEPSVFPTPPGPSTDKEKEVLF